MQVLWRCATNVATCGQAGNAVGEGAAAVTGARRCDWDVVRRQQRLRRGRVRRAFTGNKADASFQGGCSPSLI